MAIHQRAGRAGCSQAEAAKGVTALGLYEARHSVSVLMPQGRPGGTSDSTLNTQHHWEDLSSTRYKLWGDEITPLTPQEKVSPIPPAKSDALKTVTL